MKNTDDPERGDTLKWIPYRSRKRAGRIVVYRDAVGELRATVFASNGRALFVSSEGYNRRRDLLAALDVVGQAISNVQP